MSSVTSKTGRQPASRRGEARVAALREAAASVFAEQGYEAATMTEIAARAGASIGSLYQYFPTKEAIAADLHAAYLDALNAALAGMSGGHIEPAALSDQLLKQVSDFLDRYPAFPALAGRRDIDPAHKAASRTRFEHILEDILRMSAPALPAAALPALAALLLQQIKIVVALRSSGRPEDLQAIEHLRQMVSAHLRQQSAHPRPVS